MVHSILRPSEWKLLQNKHIRVFSDEDIDQPVISVPNSKTKNAKGSIDSTTTEVAADLYVRKILPRHDDKNDYLFFNDIRDRTYAGDRVSKMFKYPWLGRQVWRQMPTDRHTPPTLSDIHPCVFRP